MLKAFQKTLCRSGFTMNRPAFRQFTQPTGMLQHIYWTFSTGHRIQPEENIL